MASVPAGVAENNVARRSHWGVSLPRQSKVTLKVYNMLGQEMATLVSATLGAGRYSSQFDASRLSSGTYVYRLAADNFVKTGKMLLIK